VRPESTCTIRVMTSTTVGRYNRSRNVRPESGSLTGVGMYKRSHDGDRSHDVDWSCDIVRSWDPRPEL
jgi:hypothetical protein